MIDPHGTSRTKRMTLMGLLTWFSFQNQQAVDGRSNGPSIQHRVKRSHRRVGYDSTSQRQRRRTSASAHPSRRNVRSRSTHNNFRAEPEENRRKWDLQKEVHSDDVLWVFGAANLDDTNSINQDAPQEFAEDTIGNSKKTLWRHLYDQFVGEELLPSNGYGTESKELIGSTTNNDTAEVEFENIDSTAHDSSLGVSSNATTTITTAVVGNSTNTTTGNITVTESVVYTTNNEEINGAIEEGNSTIYTNSDNQRPSDDANPTVATENMDSNGTYGEDFVFDEEPQFQPLRMRAILAEDSGKGSVLNVTEREILFYDLLSPALLAWSSSLRVDPVVGNLTVDVHQLVDGVTCGPGLDSGLPSIKVPLQHLEEGIPDTDMIVYLSLGFTEVAAGADYPPGQDNNETGIPGDNEGESSSEPDDDDGGADSSGTEANKYEKDRKANEEPRDDDEDRMRVLTTLRNPDTLQGSQPASSSLSNDNSSTGDTSDANIETTTTINICTGEYLAAASYCSTDQFDRPTAALLHLCIDDSFFDPRFRQRNTMTLVHELGHALGFNVLSMAHFRKPDGTPYTPRNKDGDVPDTKVECTGPEDEHQYAKLPLPSEEILQFRNVRGGVRVAEIVTPSVVQVVRNQFDCQLLTGAELESSEGSPLSTNSHATGNKDIIGAGACIGDHWERRLFSSDVMNPIVDDIEYSTRISTLTLAYFADSGWYQVDLSNANVASGWGRGAGCNFVNDTCINEYGDVPPQNAPFFCNEVTKTPDFLSLAENIHGCTPDLSRKARCSIGQYDLDIPKAYQYFNYMNSTVGSKVGGFDALMDFCPVYDGYENGLCSNKGSETLIRANEIERFGLRNSRCLVGNVSPRNQNTALCLPIACVLEDRSLRVKLGEDWHICDHADQMIESSDQSVQVTCPDPRRICPTFFCPYDCLGTGGKCDYNSGKCLCQYKNATHPEETVLDVCGLEEVYEESALETNNNRTAAAPASSSTKTKMPILQRNKGKTESLMPPKDAKISDYYVSDVLHLDDTPRFFDAMGILILIVTAMGLTSFFVALFTFRKPLQEASSVACNYLHFWKRPSQWDHDEGNDGIGQGGSEHGINNDSNIREKHKMVASVLVDMRIREHDTQASGFGRWRRRRHQQHHLNESLAETDGRMTDSEIASSAPPGAMSDSLSEVSSSRQMMDESMCSELEDNEDGSKLDEAAEEEPPLPSQPTIMRRRRFAPNFFS